MMNMLYTAQLAKRQKRPKRRKASQRALNASAAARVANTPAGSGTAECAVAQSSPPCDSRYTSSCATLAEERVVNASVGGRADDRESRPILAHPWPHCAA